MKQRTSGTSPAVRASDDCARLHVVSRQERGERYDKALTLPIESCAVKQVEMLPLSHRRA